MPVDPKRVETLFHRAIGLPAADRPAFLAAACGDDADLRGRVDRLLAAHDEIGSPPPGPSDAAGAHASGVPPFSTGDRPTAMFAPDVPAPAPTHAYPTKDEHAGAVIAGKYTLIEVIGEGGMGSVWRAEQTEPVKRFVAVKLIKAGMDSRQVLARFEAERQALALMDHPNIAKVLDGGLHEQSSVLRHGTGQGGADHRLLRQVQADAEATAGTVRAGVRGDPARSPEGDDPPRHQAVERAASPCTMTSRW